MGGTSDATLLTWLPAAVPTPSETGRGPREGATDAGRERSASPMGCPLAVIPGIRGGGSRIAWLEGLDEGRVNPVRQQAGRRPREVRAPRSRNMPARRSERT